MRQISLHDASGSCGSGSHNLVLAIPVGLDGRLKDATVVKLDTVHRRGRQIIFVMSHRRASRIQPIGHRCVLLHHFVWHNAYFVRGRLGEQLVEDLGVQRRQLLLVRLLLRLVR